MQQNDEIQVLQSWHSNADAWTRAVREGLIDSRRQATDRAILEAVLATAPQSVLDVGCGEGWLVRALAAQGIDAMGIDAVPGLIERAREAGGRFQVVAYDELDRQTFSHRVNTVVCNFSMMGAASVEGLLMALPARLETRGWLLVQTVHPLMACGDGAYADGWKVESWHGFGIDFPAPAPWYFRTLESWIRLFIDTGWRLCAMREPLHPQTGRPASVIFAVQRH